MWTASTRAQHARKGPGLPSDLTDAEWALVEPFLPPASPFGRPREWPMRRIVDAMLYLLRDGLPWRMLPPGFPPASWCNDEIWRPQVTWRALWDPGTAVNSTKRRGELASLGRTGKARHCARPLAPGSHNACRGMGLIGLDPQSGVNCSTWCG